METADLIVRGAALWSPLTFAVLVGVAAMFVWLALAPASAGGKVEDRLDDYLDRKDFLEAQEMNRAFGLRAGLPFLKSILGILGRLAPRRNLDATQRLLVRAGEPGKLTALDFYGLRLLVALLAAVGYYLFLGGGLGISLALRNALLVGVASYFLPSLWLRRRARKRQNEIARALPDALDMMTVGVEAGLAFESALVKVGEQWDNALTRELKRAVVEMRLGVPRNDALQHMADRAGVQELNTFVAVLIQSHQMGVSIAQVLHSQAALMRERRRQRAEELARQAGIKMVFPLVFLVFPALLVVILGPSIPIFMGFLEQVVPALGTAGGVPAVAP
jgi:tight adherence protein C